MFLMDHPYSTLSYRHRNFIQNLQNLSNFLLNSNSLKMVDNSSSQNSDSSHIPNPPYYPTLCMHQFPPNFSTSLNVVPLFFISQFRSALHSQFFSHLALHICQTNNLQQVNLSALNFHQTIHKLG